MPKPRTIDPSQSTRAMYGAELRHRRERAGMSQEELGPRCSSPERMSGCWRSGRAGCSPSSRRWRTRCWARTGSSRGNWRRRGSRERATGSAHKNGPADALAEGGQQAAADAGVHFVDMRGQFTGHGACGTDPWVHGLNLTESAATFHPNAAGQEKGYAAKFKSLWG